MKKLVSLLSASVLLLGATGLIGCSGDLHDVSEVDVTTLQVKGSIFTWDSGKSEYKFTEDSDGTYYYEFIATSDSATFAIDDTGADGSQAWAKTYRGDANDKLVEDFENASSEKTVTLYPHDDGDCMPLGLEPGATYRIIVAGGPGNIECTVKKVADAIPFVLVTDDGTTLDLSATGATSFKYDFTESEAGTLKFFVQSGVAYYAPASDTALTTSVGDDAVDGVTTPADSYYTFAYEANIPYKIVVDYDKDNGTISVAAKYGDLLTGYGVQHWYTTSWTGITFEPLTRVSTTEWYWDVTATEAMPSYKFSIIIAADSWNNGRWELDEKNTLELDKEIGPLNYNNEPTRATIDIPANTTYRFTLIDKDGTGNANNVFVKVTKL